MLRWSAHVLMGLFLLSLAACDGTQNLEPLKATPEKDYGRPLPPGALALRKIGPEQYPDFSRGYENLAGLEQAIQHSLNYLSKPSSKKYFPYGDISHQRAVASLNHFLQVLHSVRSGAELDAAIRRDYDVYQSVGCDDKGTVLFTGYYTPIFEGRKQPDARFRYPLYGAPPDLVKNEEGITQGRRTPEGQIVPYYTRRQIVEGGLLDGTEVAWLKDPFEAYVVTVQGSAKLRLADGSLYELGYAGNNGHQYTPIALQMIKDGVMRRNELSLQTMLKYFASHPDKVNYYTLQNDRFVFFKERAGGPFGCLNVPVTPYRSIATDKEVFPRACLSFLTTALPVMNNETVQVSPYSGFALDQDAGGAIRAAGRSDVYMGIGPRAEAIAGRTGAEGALYYIFLKEGAVARQQ